MEDACSETTNKKDATKEPERPKAPKEYKPHKSFQDKHLELGSSESAGIEDDALTKKVFSQAELKVESDIKDKASKEQMHEEDRRLGHGIDAVKYAEASAKKECYLGQADTKPSPHKEVFSLYEGDVNVEKVLKQIEMLEIDQSSMDLGKTIQMYLEEGKIDQARYFLENMCSKIRKREEESCVEVYPAYKLDNPSEPLIALLQKEPTPVQMELIWGIDVYKRCYDDVSQEAAKVMNSQEVRNNLFTVKENEEIRLAIRNADLTKKHSNITLISSCPFRSMQGGNVLKRQKCIVIHCLWKGLIPFGEKPFPRKIQGIAVDVREGYCQFGMLNPSVLLSTASTFANDADDDVEMPDDPVTSGQAARAVLTKGTKSDQYNEKLLMGTGIGPSGTLRRGTLGGFVKLQGGSMGFLTCAHVVDGVGTKVSQPAADDVGRSFECGEVIQHVFEPGSLDETGIDVALVKITDPNRAPFDGDFVGVRQSQLLFAGLDHRSPPKFPNGKILRVAGITEDQKRMSVLKFGSETGLTIGLVHQNGAYGRQITKTLKLPPPDGREIEFFNQFEILSVTGTSTRFFDLGDSGALVFLLLEGKELHCLGFAIGVTNYGSCLVTPIEEVLDKLSVTFVDFTRITDDHAASSANNSAVFRDVSSLTESTAPSLGRPSSPGPGPSSRTDENRRPAIRTLERGDSNESL